MESWIQYSGLTADQLREAAQELLSRNSRIRDALTMLSGDGGSRSVPVDPVTWTPEEMNAVPPVFNSALNLAAQIPDSAPFTQQIFAQLAKPDRVLDFLTHVQTAIGTGFETVEKPVADLNLSIVELRAALKAFLDRNKEIRDALHTATSPTPRRNG